MGGAVYDLFTRTWKDEQRNRFRDGVASAIESFMEQKYGSSPTIWDWNAFIATARKPSV